MTVVDPGSFTLVYDAAHTFPFCEDEDGNITGYGHQDAAEFAQQVNLYDTLANGTQASDDDLWQADDVGYSWVLLHEDNERLIVAGVTSETPGAFEVMTLWGQR